MLSVVQRSRSISLASLSVVLQRQHARCFDKLSMTGTLAMVTGTTLACEALRLRRGLSRIAFSKQLLDSGFTLFHINLNVRIT